MKIEYFYVTCIATYGLLKPPFGYEEMTHHVPLVFTLTAPTTALGNTRRRRRRWSRCLFYVSKSWTIVILLLGFFVSDFNVLYPSCALCTWLVTFLSPSTSRYVTSEFEWTESFQRDRVLSPAAGAHDRALGCTSSILGAGAVRAGCLSTEVYTCSVVSTGATWMMTFF